jgi:hypothetical protein
VLVANLFVHHFEGESLVALGRWIRNFEVILLNEPDRRRLPHLGNAIRLGNGHGDRLCHLLRGRAGLGSQRSALGSEHEDVLGRCCGGSLLLNGQGVRQDYGKAHRWLLDRLQIPFGFSKNIRGLIVYR